MKRRLYILFSLITAFPAVNAQEVTVTAAFDTSRIYVGDQINYTVTVDQPSGLKLYLAAIKDTLFKSIEILAGPKRDTLSLENSRLRVVNKYLVTSFDSGFYQVPPIYAELSGENGLKRFYSDYSLLEVMRVKITPPDTATKIFDIIEPYKAPVTVGEILPWVLLAALAVALIWAIIRLLRRFRKTKQGYEPVKNPDPAHVIAFRDLDKLRDQKLWQKGEVKQYYSRLTEIIRQYLENRYGVFSLELTTSETLDKLLKTGFKKDETFRKLRTILTGSDLVKFAKYKPDPSENELHFENSWQFVDITRKREEVNASVPTNGSEEKKQ